MRIRPNHTVLEAQVTKIRRHADGVGADVTVRVAANLGEGSPDDATGAKAGDLLVLFSATPEALARGGRYRFETSVLGGPGGERVVVNKADEIKG